MKSEDAVLAKLGKYCTRPRDNLEILQKHGSGKDF